MNLIEGLEGQLLFLGVQEERAHTAALDVARRLAALWPGRIPENVRRTILLTGREEAFFYEPRGVDLQVRELVVAAVRNSAIEHLHVDGILQEPRQVTEWAVSLVDSSLRAGFEPDDDADTSFCHIPDVAPQAFAAMQQLAQLSPSQLRSRLPESNLRKHRSGVIRDANPNVVHQLIVHDGMSRYPTPELERHLMAVESGNLHILFTPTLKHLTRNLALLFEIIERILNAGGTVVTCNWLMSPQLVAKRLVFVHVPSGRFDINALLADQNGLSRSHARVLQTLVPK